MSHKDFAKIKLNPPFYTAYLHPNGFLDTSYESHALWNYYTKARNAYETHDVDAIILEGQKERTTNFRQLFESIATLYSVNPDAMAKCWAMVDMQCLALGLPKLPDEERFRFNRVDTIRLN